MQAHAQVSEAGLVRHLEPAEPHPSLDRMNSWDKVQNQLTFMEILFSIIFLQLWAQVIPEPLYRFDH